MSSTLQYVCMQGCTKFKPYSDHGQNIQNLTPAQPSAKREHNNRWLMHFLVAIMFNIFNLTIYIHIYIGNILSYIFLLTWLTRLNYKAIVVCSHKNLTPKPKPYSDRRSRSRRFCTAMCVCEQYITIPVYVSITLQYLSMWVEHYNTCLCE